MPLSGLVGVSNFCLICSCYFFSIVCIPSCQAILMQILLYTFFPGFPWSTLLSFLSYFNFHNLTYLEIDVSTHDMIIAPQTALNYHILKLHTLSTSLTSHIILIIRHSNPCNLASSATVNSHVSQQSNTTLINIPMLLQR